MHTDLPTGNKLVKRALFGAILSAACLSASAASFDCAKARSKSERLICGDPQLSALDDRLAALAAAGKKRAASPRAYQRALDAAWSVRQKCDDIACVESWYSRRIAELSNAQPETDSNAERAADAPAPQERASTVRVPAAPAPQPKAQAPQLPAPKPKVEPPQAAAPVAKAEPPRAAPAHVAEKRAPEAKPNIPAAPRREVPKPVVVAPAKPNVSPGAQLQVIGSELGFSIPLTREEFLERYEASGGQCGAGQHLASLKALSRLVTFGCLTGSECRAPTAGLSCKVLGTGYDSAGRLVLFTTTLDAGVGNGADGARDLNKLVQKFAEFGGGETRTRDVRKGRVLSSRGSQGQFQFDAEVLAEEGERQVGTFAVATK